MQTRSSRDIGLIIRERRRALALDQAELAKRVKVSRQWIVEAEKGKPHRRTRANRRISPGRHRRLERPSAVTGALVALTAARRFGMMRQHPP